MYLHYAEQQEAYECPCQYMLGPNMIVSPVHEPGGIKSTWIPAGKWISLVDKKIIKGPAVVTNCYTIDEIPLFIKAGSVMPMQKPNIRAGSTQPDPLMLKVYPGGNDKLELYEDDGESPGCENGSFSLLPISLKSSAKSMKLVIGKAKGSFPTMKQTRKIEIEILSSRKPSKVFLNGSRAKYAFDSTMQTVSIAGIKKSVKEAAELIVEF
jgi:alpha-glucosidase (family GH31 glycosyl hydrolase)